MTSTETSEPANPWAAPPPPPVWSGRLDPRLTAGVGLFGLAATVLGAITGASALRVAAMGLLSVTMLAGSVCTATEQPRSGRRWTSAWRGQTRVHQVAVTVGMVAALGTIALGLSAIT